MALDIRPLSKHIGAEVKGIDLSAPISDDHAEALRRAFRQYRLLVVKQPGLGIDEQVRFTEIFGDLYESRAYKTEIGTKGYFFSNTRPDGQLPTGELEYHHDHMFNEVPIKAAILYGIEVPKSGSATKFRDAVELAARLPEPLRRKADGVKCLHVLDYENVTQSGRVDLAKVSPKARRAWQPLLWRQPETETEALWVVPMTTADFDGIDRDEGERLLSDVWRYAEDVSDIEYAHYWTEGDLLIWDNLLLAHARLPFESSEPRTLRRTSVRG